MEKELLEIPSGCLEPLENQVGNNCFKVNRMVLKSKEPSKGKIISVFMVGSGFGYYGVIYHKSAQYIYVRLLEK